MIVRFLCVAGVLSAMSATVAADDPETIRLREAEYEVWPLDDLIERGFDLQPVPRAENAAWIYIDAINAYVELPPELEAALDYASTTAWPVGHAGFAEYMAAPGNRTALMKVREASRLDRCQIPYFGDSSGSIMSVLLPSLSGFRSLGKLEACEGRRLESNLEYVQALECYITAMRTGEHVGQGMTLIEGLVGIAIWTMAERASMDLVLRRPLSLEQLRGLQRELAKRALRVPTAKRGLEGERTFGPALIDELCAHPLRIPANIAGEFAAEPGDWLGTPDACSNPHEGWGKLELCVGQLIFPDRTIKKHMLGFYDLVCRRAENGPSMDPKLEFDEAEYVRRSIPVWDVFSRSLLPSLSRATLLGERAQAEMALLRTAVALRIRMLENDGAIPSSLAELDGKLPREVMVDPFGGAQLVYRVTENGWRLYSLGPNLIDDGGQRAERWDSLDLAYQYPPLPVEPFLLPEREE